MDRAVFGHQDNQERASGSRTKVKKIIWLHIGMHKTGSSSIQQSLADYSDGTLRCARLGAPNHSKAMKLLFSSRFDDDVRMQRKIHDAPFPARQQSVHGRHHPIIG
jgi:hypothetical protein